ncbi:uncharacterized protein DSM5745_08106 [Aspergillus mulundensis]|uniref:Uncharacterized protein n=1 Tax=Aspergillus mulundensis TaxID=1810919 RepID=A0A3D8R992_9EURO|nr:Uncharacterized protein DSM5745_08106 [Aspergillus mulundensis]RDW70595.1 Uncharacterized protein DSM5745_08106 [Aspergillus mulundensis]
MATAEKQQKSNPIKDEPQDSDFEQKPSAKGPPQEEDDYSDDYSDEYDDDDDYSDEYDDDDYYSDEEEQDQAKAMQAYKPNAQSISSRDGGNQNMSQKINNGNISRAPDNKKTIDDQDGLKLKVDVNLDIEVELKARIHGDLTLALL